MFINNDFYKIKQNTIYCGYKLRNIQYVVLTCKLQINLFQKVSKIWYKAI